MLGRRRGPRDSTLLRADTFEQQHDALTRRATLLNKQTLPYPTHPGASHTSSPHYCSPLHSYDQRLTGTDMRACRRWSSCITIFIPYNYFIQPRAIREDGRLLRDSATLVVFSAKRPKGWHAMYLNYEHERGGQPEYSLTAD
jgi:hypothetical protein